MTDDASPPTELVIAVELDGTRHEYRPYDVTPAQASALRVQSHGAWRIPILHRAVFEDNGLACGPEEIAGLVFLARRQAGENVTYDAVCDGINGASQAVIDFEVPSFDPEVIDSPEA